MTKEGKTWNEVIANPTLLRGSISNEEGKRIRWHSSAHLPHSSQVFCASVFGKIRSLTVKDWVINRLVGACGFPTATGWTIELEAVEPELLSEYGVKQSSSIDVLLRSKDTVIAVEAKFLSDARAGFGCCKQFPKSCGGYFGPGSDLKTKSGAWCRLETWDGRRSPRTYWSVGRGYFRDSVYARQSEEDRCPFRGGNYQLMRNFLFAAAHSRKEKLSNFGMIVVAPAATSKKLRKQLDEFKRSVLQPQFHQLAHLTTYETMIDALNQTAEFEAKLLAAFLEERITTLINS